MPRFRKKPVVIEAEQYAPERAHNIRSLCRNMSCVPANLGAHIHTIHDDQIVVLEPGDWIIPEPDGIHFYPCKPLIFEATYEPVED